MGSKKNSLSQNDSNIEVQDLTEIIDLIDSAKIQVANYTNSTLVLLYWKIGSRINKIKNDTKYAFKWLLEIILHNMSH